MSSYLLILPVAFLVAYSQLMVKLRSSSTAAASEMGVMHHLLSLLSDPWVVSAYSSALIASFAWLFVVTKLPLTTAFPVYIGVIFLMVLVGGWLFLGEAMTLTKVAAALLILAGVALGIRA
jgi:multidrug transporter EmrE-like cation transporter